MSSGPSSIASFAKSAAPDSVPSVCARGLGSGGCGIARIQTSDGSGEVMGIEGLKIVDALADADCSHGKAKALGYGHENATACGAIKLGHHQAGDARDLLKGLHLVQRVLPGRGVEHESHAMRCRRIELLQHAHDLGELRHQVRLVLQPSGSVNNEHIPVVGACALKRLIGNAGRIGPHILGHDLGADALTPDFELVDGRGTEGVSGGEHYGRAFSHELMRELCRSGGLTGSVHSNEQNHMRMSALAEHQGFGHWDKHVRDLSGQHLSQGLLRQPALMAGLGKRRPDAPGHRDTEISPDQRIFELIERLVVELLSAQHRGEIIAERRRGAGKPLAKPREPALIARLGLRGVVRSLLAAAHAVVLAIRALPSWPLTMALTSLAWLSKAAIFTGVKSSARPRPALSMSTWICRPLALSRWRRKAATPLSRNAAARSAVTLPWTCRMRAAGVPGRAENGKTCRKVSLQSSISDREPANIVSLSVGKPAIKSAPNTMSERRLRTCSQKHTASAREWRRFMRFSVRSSPACRDRCRCGISRSSSAIALSSAPSASTESTEERRKRFSSGTSFRILVTSLPSVISPGRSAP